MIYHLLVAPTISLLSFLNYDRNSKRIILPALIFVLFFYGCISHGKYSGTYESITNYSYSSFEMKPDGSYVLVSSSDLITHKGTGNWVVGENDTIIINSRYHKNSINIYKKEQCQNYVSIDSISFVITSSDPENPYEISNCEIFINDSIRVFPRETILMDESYQKMYIEVEGVKSKSVQIDKDSGGQCYSVDIPSGGLRFYPFFENQKCIIKDNQFFILDGRPEEMALKKKR